MKENKVAKLYGLVMEDIPIGSDITITHPSFGTVSMTVKVVGKDYVEGLVWNEEGYHQYNMPEDYHGSYEYMNFPIACVRKVDRPVSVLTP